MLKRTIIINGVKTTLVQEAEEKLSDVLRKQLGLTGTKVGCGSGECGTCTVIHNGKLIRACITKMKKWKIMMKSSPLKVQAQKTNSIHFKLRGWFMVAHNVASVLQASLSQQKHFQSKTTTQHVKKYVIGSKNKNLCRCTGYKPLVDAVMDAAKIIRGELSVKDFWKTIPEGASLIGSSLVRPSAMAKVMGTWDFGADLGLKLPSNTLHAKIVQAKVSHANIISIDTEEAKKVPGVVAVLTYKRC